MESVENKLDILIQQNEQIIGLLKASIMAEKGNLAELAVQLANLTREVKIQKFGEGYPKHW